MESSPRLQAGSEVRCPHCRRWHLVVRVHREGTETLRMMYVECRGARYYAGQEGQASRHRIRDNRRDVSSFVDRCCPEEILVLISFAGLPGSGKSTIARLLA